MRSSLENERISPGYAAVRGRPSVVYWNNIPTPYVQDRFNALARRDNMEFEAWFISPRESDRSWQIDESDWHFRYRYLPGVGSNEGRLVLPMPLLAGAAPQLIISLHAAPSFVLGRLVTRARGIRHAFYMEVTFDSWIRRRRWKEMLKKRLISGSDAVITAGRDASAYAQKYGAVPGRTFEVPNCTDVDYFDRRSQMPAATREARRRELKISGTTFIYVGRLWNGKGLLYLLEAFRQLRRLSADPVSLMIVGDGPQENELRHKCVVNDIQGVRFLGFRQRDELPSLYRLADVFVFPTLGDPWGMVVEEAMACGLPIVTTSAAGEIRDRVIAGQNALVIPPAATQPLVQAMLTLTQNVGLRQEMGALSKEMVRGRTPERWACNLEHAVDRILSLPGRTDRV